MAESKNRGLILKVLAVLVIIGAVIAALFIAKPELFAGNMFSRNLRPAATEMIRTEKLGTDVDVDGKVILEKDGKVLIDQAGKLGLDKLGLDKLGRVTYGGELMYDKDGSPILTDNLDKLGKVATDKLGRVTIDGALMYDVLGKVLTDGALETDLLNQVK
ncbi:hypothetical protein KKD70_01690 [Patescibacteria group bacterium]|nr:hypothetical protein [Patescibacteria group bacterium]